MSLTNEERSTLVELELKKATPCNHALMINDGHSVNTHHGSHALFNMHYIKTGIMPVEFGRLYNQLQTMREESDYNCVYDVEPDELRIRIEPARQLIERIKQYITEKNN